MPERKYNNGQWTKARFNSFVKSALRSASRRWPAKYECLNEAYVSTQVNSKTGRQAKHFRCNECKNLFPSKDVQVDHIESIIDPTVGFISWDETVNRLFCEKENLQVLCKDCHTVKTNAEKALSKERRTNDKKQ